MDSQIQASPPQAQPSNAGLHFRTWLEVNKKRVAIGVAAAALVVVVVVIFLERQAGKETAASQALSDIRIPFSPAVTPEPGTADKLLQVANQYRGTKAAASALHISAGILYTEKDFARAQERFNSVIQQYPDCLWVSDAHLGVAACLEAQGKIEEATKKFEDIRKRYATMPIIDDAKLSLARLYENSNPTESFKLYDELLKGNPNSGKAAEAGMRQEELLKKHPELAKLKEPVNPPPPPQPAVQITPMTNRPPPGTNRVVNLSNLTQRVSTTGGMSLTTGSPVRVKLNPNPVPAPTQPPPPPAK
ncbi:MAG: Tetratricopeptide repeat-like domain [Verrucomicrobiota bacterium]|jgi:predicted negative regulator of RcsB-dependent stress response